MSRTLGDFAVTLSELDGGENRPDSSSTTAWFAVLFRELPKSSSIATISRTEFSIAFGATVA